MRIGEVSTLTGLTERTIRYYEEVELITPEKQERGERIYRYYSEEDVSELETISALRKLLFSIDEIKTMRTEPGLIPDILSDYKSRLLSLTQKMTDVLEVIDRLDMRYVSDMTSLAKGFKLVAAKRTLPAQDVTPNFSKIDQLEGAETKTESSKAIISADTIFQKQIDRGEKMVIAIIATDIIGSVIDLLLDLKLGNFLGVIITIVLAVGLMSGKRWAHVIHVILLGVNVVLAFITLVTIPPIGGTLFVLLKLLMFALMCWRIVSMVWLTTSKSVDAFLNYKR